MNRTCGGRNRLCLGGTLLFCAIASGAAGAGTRGTDLVTVHSAASEHYLARKFGVEGPLPETYIFVQGKYFGGASRDRTITNTDFSSIALMLAGDLTRQNYYPIKDPTTADLLLVVHWGTTLVPEDFDALEQMQDQFNSGEMSEDEINFFQLMRETDAMSVDYSVGYNARLLGYTDAFAMERKKLTASGVTAREHDLKHQLIQERYFIIVMAYDYHVLREKKEKRLLWSTRFSMRTPGKNFAEALPAMTRVAGDYFGTELRNLETKRTHIGEGRIEMSEIEVIEMESPPEPPVPPPPNRN